jgi:methylated-DNA-protein-cysteine methyltransferase-like protein
VTFSGKLAFEKSSRNYKRQVRRLGEENVPVVGGRVEMGKYRWEPDLDELLWKPSAAWDES